MCVGNSLRLVTHRLAIMLLEQLLWVPGAGPALQDHHVALVESVYEAAILQLRLFYKGSRDEIFLDMFEDEYRNEEVGTGQSELVPLSVRVCAQAMEVRVQYLLQEGSMLLPPTDTPLTGIEFTRRLPCGENERARKVDPTLLPRGRAQTSSSASPAGHESVLCHAEAEPDAAGPGREGAATD